VRALWTVPNAAWLNFLHVHTLTLGYSSPFFFGRACYQRKRES
jgi:hypothetical protein